MISVAVAANWAIRVPFFQNPDEAAHADYAFALYDAGGPFSVKDARAGSMVMPQTRYLAGVARYRALRYNTRAALPPGFGTRAFFESVDAHAPKASHAVPVSGAVVPYVMFSYPPLYYALIASVMTVASALANGSLVAAFFSARLVSTVFLAGTLVLAFAIFRRSGQSRATALLATTAVGLLPLSSTISASVQPDTLAALLVNGALFLTLSVRRSANATRAIGLLALTLSCLTFVKAHYALALCVACVPACLTLRKRLPYAIAFVLPVLGFVLAPRLTPVASVHLPALGDGETHSFADAASLALRLAASELRDIYFGGIVSQGFWMRFGFRAGSAYTGTVRDVLLFALSAFSLMTLAFVAIREGSVLRAIGRIASHRSIGLAARLLSSGVLLNAYLATTALLIGVFIATSGQLALQGRYWFPVLVPTIALTIVVVPHVLRARARRRASFAIACAWAAYAIVSSPCAIVAREYDYYAVKHDLPTKELGEIQSAIDGHGHASAPDAIVSERGETITLSGYAIDGERGLPAHRLILELPKHTSAQTRLGVRSYDVYRTFNDPALMDSGFTVRLTIGNVRPGTYRGRVLESEDRAPRGLPIGDFVVIVEPGAKP